MKLEPARIDRFLADPGSARCVLLYGDDTGLVRERAARLRRAVIGSGADDAFRITELDKSTIADLPNEVASASLTGGRRVVHVRDASDFAADPVRRALAANADGIIILEALSLPPRSKLRSLIEASAAAVAIACYPETARGLGATISQTLARYDIAVEPPTVAWLAGQLGSDRALTRQELDKLALYVGDDSRLNLEDARACVGDAAGLVIEDALYAATRGDLGVADRACHLALAEGAAPIQLLRAALMHLQRLARARAVVDSGRSVTDAASTLRPPLFRMRQAAFEDALRRWTTASLTSAANRVFEAELACKHGVLPPDHVARNAIIAVARRGSVARG